MDYEREKGRKAGALVRQRKAVAFAKEMIPAFELAREAGAITLRGFADWLNQNDYKTVKGKNWRAQSVSSIRDVDVQARAIAQTEFEIADKDLVRVWRNVLPSDHKRKAEIKTQMRVLRAKRDAEWEAANSLGRAVRGEPQPTAQPDSEKYVSDSRALLTEQDMLDIN